MVIDTDNHLFIYIFSENKLFRKIRGKLTSKEEATHVFFTFLVL